MNNIGSKEGVLFTFSTKDLSRTEKVKFHYSLKGRNGSEGFLDKVEGIHLGSSIIFTPNEHSSILSDFFVDWNVLFEKRSIILKDDIDKENLKEDGDLNL